MMKMLRKTGLALLGSALLMTGYGQSDVPKGWHLKDLKTDGYYGISLDKAYDFLKSKNKKSQPVIAGIIDSGIDTTHEDLRPVLWTNKGEIPGNGIDDDKNGYIDDVHGWNFIGARDGKNVTKDSYEAARIYWKWKSKFDGKGESGIPQADQEQYQIWLRAKNDVFKPDENGSDDIFLETALKMMKMGDEIIRIDLKKKKYTLKDLSAYRATTYNASQFKDFLISFNKDNNSEDLTNKDLLETVGGDVEKINNKKRAPEPYRDEVVKDNYDDINDRYYGNNNLTVDDESSMHGTHVAGIVGAARNNGKGMDGVADNVQIMAVRTVPNGDEHDKDIALAIRYAVDNGARVINMSFGKGFSPEKKWVDDAVKYAVDKGVLLVHAAGNDNENNDTTYNFPSAYYLDKSRPATWLTVGASGPDAKSGLVAKFSNYGKREVDVFAPGVLIYSTLPEGDVYGNQQGTSMAAPVVTGLAALIMSYYPELSAVQVKEIIERSAIKPAEKVINPETKATVSLSDLSVSGGIVNAYEAVKLADTYRNSDHKALKPAAKKRK
ncbi:S8 family peptidase [Niabella drilacis]|uniref:Subtilase family protein n=1 Tax=Niabella drilacis (strain DSM 25811 / CCM 8410 / CCUG 62505 / LMG 26954 / E90) TaxID=1285928 RepID=A0A1G6U1D4_NIADE|nr:S8 family peptidase [Niabella drilacis]SDD35212.1 Subtilase family protein [Niabella drilacis]